MLAVLPLLIQWFALSQLGSQNFVYKQNARPSSHWSLVHDLHQLPEEEIDHFLPQVCNMMLDRSALSDDSLYNYFESVVEHKCAECFSFGTKVCAVLKATQQPPSESLLKSFLVPTTSTSVQEEERLRAFIERAEYATAYGYNLPPEVSEQRSSYYRDYQFMLDSLARLGTELKDYPVSQRNAHLRHALGQFNSLLYYRMASRGSVSAMKVSIQDILSFPELTAHNIATLCPLAAEYSLHLPLHQCSDRVMRILRFVEQECEVLPSKERCPYLVTVEVLEQDFDCKSDLLYAQGRKAAVSLTLGAKPGQVTYSGQMRLPPASSTDSPSSAVVSGSVGGDFERRQDYEETDVKPAIATTTTRSYRYGAGRRRGSLLSDNLTRTAGTGNPRGRAELLTAYAHNSDQAPVAGESIPSSSTSDGRRPPANDGEDVCVIPGTMAKNLLGGKELRGGQSPGNLPEKGTDSQDTRSRPPSVPRHRNWRRGYSSAQPTPLSAAAVTGSAGYLRPRHSSPTQLGPHPVESPTHSLPPEADPTQDPPYQTNDAAPVVHATAREHLGRPLTRPTALQPHAQGPYDPHASQLHHGTHHHLHPVRRYVRPKTAEERRAIVRAQSPFGHLPGWNMKSFIVKVGADLRKEILAMQLMEFCKRVFELEGLDIYLRPYQIISTGAQSGLVEFLDGAEAIDKIHKTLPKGASLKQYFELNFGESYSLFYAKGVKNFVRSLVGYSLLTYLVQVKDRHNANILIDGEGHVLHIDFGYILGDSPGFNINFESAPFKLTKEYLDLLGGPDSEDFKLFQDLFLRGFLALQKHIDGITSIIQLYFGDKRRAAADGVRSRLLFPQSQADILSLIRDSVDNWRTKQYDWYQERTNNIL